MPIWAIGLNHKTAPVDLRERVAFDPAKLEYAHQQASEDLGVDGVVILSTCNRTEVIVNGEVEAQAVIDWLSSYHGVIEDSISDAWFSKPDREAVQHMMQVASGLDSLVLGEPQILGQVKSAYAVAQQSGTVSPLLHRLFQSVFSAAKQVRTQTAIGHNPVSVAYAAVTLSQRIFSDLSATNVLLVGAGDTIDLVAQHLVQQGVTRLTVANRTFERAHELAQRFNAKAALFSDLAEELVKADIVISSTASPLPIIGKGMVESAMKARRHQPQFMVDIAVPRDIEAEVSELDDVYLYTVDDLQSVIEEGQRAREEAAIDALDIIDANVTQFQDRLKASSASGLIKQYRQNMEDLRVQELEKSLRQLENGDDPERVIRSLARSLTNKIIHSPTSALIAAAKNDDQTTLDAADNILGLSLSSDESETP